MFLDTGFKVLYINKISITDCLMLQNNIKCLPWNELKYSTQQRLRRPFKNKISYVLPGTYGHFESPAKTEKHRSYWNIPLNAILWITYSLKSDCKKNILQLMILEVFILIGTNSLDLFYRCEWIIDDFLDRVALKFVRFLTP